MAIESKYQCCRKCGVGKPIEEFYKYSYERGYQRVCKSCTAAISKAYRLANKETIKAQRKAWRAANAEKLRLARKAYYQKCQQRKSASAVDDPPLNCNCN